MTAAKGSFEKQTSDLCHNSPSGLTQIGAALCLLTLIGLTSQQSGAELCHLQDTHHHSSSQQSQLTNANDTDRVTQIAGPICVDPFCSEVRLFVGTEDPLSSFLTVSSCGSVVHLGFPSRDAAAGYLIHSDWPRVFVAWEDFPSPLSLSGAVFDLDLLVVGL